MQKKYIITTVFIALSPALAFAATSATLAKIITDITNYLNDVLFLLMALAIVIFVWYVIKYFIMPNEDRSKAGDYMLYSIIGFFVILSLWGIVNILNNTFGVGNSENKPASMQNLQNLFPQ